MSHRPATLQTLLVLVAVLVVSGAMVLQQREISRLRLAMVALAGLRDEQASISPTGTDALPTDIEELRRVAAEVHHLRAEVSQLRREKVDMSALRESIDKLTTEVSSKPANINRSPRFSYVFSRPSNASPIVSQAASLAQTSPEEAARWVAALPSGEEQNQAALAVIARWTGSDPVAAATWTTQFPEGPLREQAMSFVAREWSMQDRNAAAGWLETLSMGSSRDSAIGAFVTAVDGYDIRLAAEWANRTEDPESRAARVTGTLQRWLSENNSAARTWIEQAQLPAEIAGRILPGE